MGHPGATIRLARSRMLLAGLAASTLGLLWLPVSSLGDLHHDLSLRSQTAAQLRAAIAAESQQIAATSAGLRSARIRLAALQRQSAAREAQLAAVQRQVVAARDRLTQLENRLQRAAKALAASLRADYEDPQPDVVTVIVNSHGFADMLERLQFMERVQQHNTHILGDTKTARTQVLAQTQRLAALERRDRALMAAVVQARNGAAALQGALLTRQ